MDAFTAPESARLDPFPVDQESPFPPMLLTSPGDPASDSSRLLEAHRSTTYSLHSTVKPTPLFRGSVAVQAAKESDTTLQNINFVSLDAEALYSLAYVPYVTAQRSQVDLLRNQASATDTECLQLSKASERPALSMFSSKGLVGPQGSVRMPVFPDMELQQDTDQLQRYISGIADLFRTAEQPKPSQADLYQIVVDQLIDIVSDRRRRSANTEVDDRGGSSAGRIRTPSQHSMTLQAEAAADEVFNTASFFSASASISPEEMTMLNHTKQADYSMLAQLIRMCQSRPNQSEGSYRLKLGAIRPVANHFSSQCIDGLFKKLREHPNSFFTSIASACILERGYLSEVLELLSILEGFDPSKELDPSVHSSVGRFTLRDSVSSFASPDYFCTFPAIDGIAEETTKLPLTIPEGTTVTAFAVSRDRQTLAIAMSQTVCVFDLERSEYWYCGGRGAGGKIQLSSVAAPASDTAFGLSGAASPANGGDGIETETIESDTNRDGEVARALLTRPCWGLQFSADGSEILFTAAGCRAHVRLRTSDLFPLEVLSTESPCFGQYGESMPQRPAADGPRHGNASTHSNNAALASPNSRNTDNNDEIESMVSRINTSAAVGSSNGPASSNVVFYEAPLLPFGHLFEATPHFAMTDTAMLTNALFRTSLLGNPSVVLQCERANIGSIKICAFINDDFFGTLVAFDNPATNDDSISVFIMENVLHCTQGQHTASTRMPTCTAGSSSDWQFLCVSWEAGAFSVHINGRSFALQNTKVGQSRAISPKTISLLACAGHVASVAVWEGPLLNSIVKALAKEQRFPQLDSSEVGLSDAANQVKLLAFVPLDEGSGRWIKELATQTAHSLPPTAGWDALRVLPFAKLPIGYNLCFASIYDGLMQQLFPSHFPSDHPSKDGNPLNESTKRNAERGTPSRRHSALAEGSLTDQPPLARSIVEPSLVPPHSVRMPQIALLGARLVSSRFQIIFIVPVPKGNTDTIIRVVKGSNVIERIFFAPSSSDTILHLDFNEKYCYSFQQRFLTFNRARVVTPYRNAKEASDWMTKEKGGTRPARSGRLSPGASEDTETGATGTVSNTDVDEIPGNACLVNSGDDPHNISAEFMIPVHVDPTQATMERLGLDQGALTVGHVVNSIYSRLAIEAFELRRSTVLHEQSPNTLVRICTSLRSVAIEKSSPIRLLALLRLAVVCLQTISRNGDKVIPTVTKIITPACRTLMEKFTSGLIHSAATQLFSLGVRKSQSPLQMAETLRSADEGQNTTIISQYLHPDTVCDIVNAALSSDTDLVVSMLEALLRRSKTELHICSEAADDNENSFNQSCSRSPTFSNSRVFPDKKQKGITPNLTWFILSAICGSRLCGNTQLVEKILEIVLDHTQQIISIFSWNDSILRTSAIQTVLMPLLHAVSSLCPDAISPNIEKSLLDLLSSVFTEEALRRPGSAPPSSANQESIICALAPPESLENSIVLPLGTVMFTCRRAMDVHPSGVPSGAWRLAIDCTDAAAVSVTRDSATDIQVVLVDARTKEVSVKKVSDREPAVKFSSGGMIFVSGAGAGSLSFVSQYAVPYDPSWLTLFRETIERALLSMVRSALAHPPAVEYSLAPLCRNGLTAAALSKRSVDCDRDPPASSQLAQDILNASGEGKDIADDCLRSMRGSVTQNMRPAFRGLLAVLVHSGLSVAQAEEELRLRWLSGEWASRLQGEERAADLASLISLTEWVVNNIHVPQHHVAGSNLRRLSAEKPTGDSNWRPGASSTSDSRRTSNSVRRSLKSAVFSDTLEHIRTLFNKGVSVMYLEDTLALRTARSVTAVRGLETLLSILSNAPSPTALDGCLRCLRYFRPSTGHFTDPYVGCGVDMESKMRRVFTKVLYVCAQNLQEDIPQSISSADFVSASKFKSVCAVMFLSELASSWDGEDIAVFSIIPGGIEALLKKGASLPSSVAASPTAESDFTPVFKYIEHLLTLPHTCLHEDNADSLVSLVQADPLPPKLFAAICDNSNVSAILPNDFNLIIPGVTFTPSDRGIIIEKSVVGGVMLRAEDGWPVSWEDGLPRNYYFEVTILSGVNALFVGLVVPQQQERGAAMQDVSIYDHSGSVLVQSREASGMPPFHEGDTVGVGFDASTQRVFYTLNGHFLGYFSADISSDLLFPAIGKFHTTDAVVGKIFVNFGTSPQQFDHRLLHPALPVTPTWFTICNTGAYVLQYLTTKMLHVQDPRTAALTSSLIYKIASITTSVIVRTVDGYLHTRTHGELVEKILLSCISILQRTVTCVSSHDCLGKTTFEAVQKLMKVTDFESVRRATITLTPSVVPLVKDEAMEGAAALAEAIFKIAKTSGDQRLVQFCPQWVRCEQRHVTLESPTHIRMMPQAPRTTMLGTPLPKSGSVSFSVRIFRENMTPSHSLKGGYFIGIANSALSPLTPTSNAQSWKLARPPQVWALHDTSPQLVHAVNPTVRPNNFQRTFGSGDLIKVVVNRDKGTVSFFRDGVFLKELFTDVPAAMEISPFVQLYNEDASATLYPGEMTPAVTSEMVLSAGAVDVLRSMIVLPPFESKVAQLLTDEMVNSNLPLVTLSVFGSLPDPRDVVFHRTSDPPVRVFVKAILGDKRAKFTIGEKSFYDSVQALRLPSDPIVRGLFSFGHDSSTRGHHVALVQMIECLKKIAGPLVRMQALEHVETTSRIELLEAERNAKISFLEEHRLRSFTTLHSYVAAEKNAAPSKPQSSGFVFCEYASHPNFTFPPAYCGRLGTVPGGNGNSDAPYIAIAEPAIPMTGRSSIRCQLTRGHHGQILGGGYYFGICLSTLSRRKRDLNASPPDAWALHDMDDTPWRLKHAISDRRLPVAVEPNCVMISGDTIRLEIDREEGTLMAFRKPATGTDEISLGIIFDNVPKGVDLFPFVHLYNTDAVAILLPPTTKTKPPRTCTQSQRHAPVLMYERRSCDGCISQHRDTKLSAPDWYRCNECVDYNLCSSCFHNCVHFSHAFTRMDPGSLLYIHSPVETQLRCNDEVIVTASQAEYLQSSSCSVSLEASRTIARSESTASHAIWGLCAQEPVFTVVVDQGSPKAAFPVSRPVFVGIAPLSIIKSIQCEELRNLCCNTKAVEGIISYCSDPRLKKKLSHTSLRPHGFYRGSCLSLSVQRDTGVVAIYRDWVLVGTVNIPASFSPDEPLAGFVVFSSQGSTATVEQSQPKTFLCTVSQILPHGVVSLQDLNGYRRFAFKDSCRHVVAKRGAESTFTCGTFAAVVHKETIVECRICDVGADQITVQLTGSDSISLRDASEFSTSPQNLFSLPEIMCENLAALSPTQRSVRAILKPTGTLGDGFVMSRILLTICTAIEQPRLLEVLGPHLQSVLPLLAEIASVDVDNNAPIAYLEEMRAGLASTTHLVRHDMFNKPLPPLIPASESEEQVVMATHGQLFTVFDPEHYGNVILVRQHTDTDTFDISCMWTPRALPDAVFMEALNLISSSPRSANADSPITFNKDTCVPCLGKAGLLWWNTPCGLPPSQTEAAQLQLEEIDWNGELCGDGSSSRSISLRLTRAQLDGDVQGTAMVHMSDDESVLFAVNGSLKKYQRRLDVTLRTKPWTQMSDSDWGPLLSDMGCAAGTTEGDSLRSCVVELLEEGVFSDLVALRSEIVKRMTTMAQSIGLLATSQVKIPEFLNRLLPRFILLSGGIDAEGVRISGDWRESVLGANTRGSFVVASLHGLAKQRSQPCPREVTALPDIVEPPLNALRSAMSLPTGLHRLVVLLARHSYLLIQSKDTNIAEDTRFRRGVIRYHSHPYAELLISTRQKSDKYASDFFAVLSKATELIIHRPIQPWDAAALARILTRSLLGRQSRLGDVHLVDVVPSFFWDSLLAVVSAAHLCGSTYRPQVIKNVIELIQSLQQWKGMDPAQAVYQTLMALLGPLTAWTDRSTTGHVAKSIDSHVAAAIEMIMILPQELCPSFRDLPLLPLRALLEISESIKCKRSLPKDFDKMGHSSDQSLPVQIRCPFGTMTDGDLKVGKIASQGKIRAGLGGRFYYEVILPERQVATFAVGWGTGAHQDIPSQHVGSDVNSVAFCGTHAVSKSLKEDYRLGVEISPGTVVGCLLDVSERSVSWSVNGVRGRSIGIPIQGLPLDFELFAFVSTGSCSGLKLCMSAHQFTYCPDGFTDLNGTSSRIAITPFTMERSLVPPKPLEFYAAISRVFGSKSTRFASPSTSTAQSSSSPVASRIAGTSASDVFTSSFQSADTSTASRRTTVTFSDDVTTVEPPPVLVAGFGNVSAIDFMAYTSHIRVVESCMSTARRYIDLEAANPTDSLLSAFLHLRSVVGSSSRAKLMDIPPLEKNGSPSVITIRCSEMHGATNAPPKSFETVLQCSILGQLSKQLVPSLLNCSPMFRVQLYLTNSGHAPQDAGGPYRQLWTQLTEEIARHPDQAFPQSEHYRSPLFRYVNNSKRTCIVPDHNMLSPMSLQQFELLGKIMGHMARARTPLALDISPFVWKFLVEDPLSIADYFADVDSVVQHSLENEDFLFSDVADDVIPGFGERVHATLYDMSSPSSQGERSRQHSTTSLARWAASSVTSYTAEDVALRREIAMQCLVSSMDAQLTALRAGLWSVLPRSCTRCMCWDNLERAVCGDPFPSIEALRESLTVQLHPTREQFFWRIVQEMSGEQRSALLCFACGQKRLPLVRKIKVLENNESPLHLPRAASCSYVITIPQYSTLETMRLKIFTAIAHPTEMELA